VARIEHGLLETLWEENQAALSTCQQKIRLLSSGQQLVLGARLRRASMAKCSRPSGGVALGE
jgi:hypothetical protein